MWLLTNHRGESSDALSHAARHAQFATVKWLHAQGCLLRLEFLECAAVGGSIEILQWAKDLGQQWNPPMLWFNAARHGHKHVLDWVMIA